MGRSGYSDDGDFEHWDTIRWRGRVVSAIRGVRGQAFLRELVAALDVMPDKRLIAEEIVHEGDVCALGSVGAMRGLDLTTLDPENHEQLAGVFNIAPSLVREIEWVNDESWGSDDAEKRWARVRKWATEQLIEWES